MIIGVKYWNRGSSAPASWTNLHVAECESTEEVYEYDSGEALDGTEFGFKRIKYNVRLLVDPFSFNHGTYGGVVTSLRKADFMRVFDARYGWLETGDTIDFVVKGSIPSRSEPSILTTSVEIIGRAVVVHT